MLDWVFGSANGWWALAAFLVLAGSTVALKITNPKKEIIEELGDDYVSTDSSFYSVPAAVKMFGRYREKPELLAAHKRFLRLHDLIFPPCYALPLVLLLAHFYPPGGRQYDWLVLLPLLGMVFDYAENSAVYSVLKAVEEAGHVPLAALKAARAFTFLKIGLIILSMFLLAGFVLYRGQAWLRGIHLGG